MIKIYSCTVCRKSWQIVGPPDEVAEMSALLPNSSGDAKCITPLCGGRLQITAGAPSGFQVTELPIRAFYRAINGFGDGENPPADLDVFKRLLRTRRIVDFQAERVGQPERIILRQLILEDGTRMHFDSSARGACCFYIERPSSCVEVVENEFNTDNSDEAIVSVSHQDREEVGRPEQENEQQVGGAGNISPLPPAA